MKTLLICGVFHVETMNLPVLYNVTLFGQTEDKPGIQYITYLELSLYGYTKLVEVCKGKYCEYFGVDANNLITLDCLHNTKDFKKLLTE